MGAVINMIDSLRSFVTGLGDPMRDKAAGTVYGDKFLTDENLINAYRTWLPKKIVNIPALDSVRKWRDWQADAADIGLIEAEENRLGLKHKLLEAKMKARLFGGAAIYIGTADQNLAEPFDPARVGRGGVTYLTVIGRRYLTPGELDRDPMSENFGKPVYYTVSGSEAGTVRLHPSRIVRLIGDWHPDEWLQVGVTAGWGDSVLQAVYDAVRNADGAAGNIAHLVFEASIDVFGIPNLMNNLASPDYMDRLYERLHLAQMGKSNTRALIMDSDETYERKQISFAQLPEVLQQLLQIVSGAADIPVTRLLGQSPAGMNATGVSDMKNYHDRIQSMQTLELTPALYRLDEALIRSSLGARPEEIHYRWSPLEQMSEKEQAEIGKSRADAAESLVRSGLFRPEELRVSFANAFIEDGYLPGLEEAMEETGEDWQAELGGGDEDEGEGDDPEADPNPIQDAAPRTLYVRRDVVNAVEIIAHFKAQGFETTLPADDLHVTIAFSRKPVDWMKMGENWSGDEAGQLTVNAGGPRMMERFGANGEATVLLFASSALSWRHESMKREGASWDHPEYQPHITISYAAGDIDLDEIEPWTGEIVLGPEIFEEVKEDWQTGIKEA